jgi:EpsI family protein
MEKTRIQTASFRLILILLVLTGALTYTLRYLQVEPDKMADFSLVPQVLGDWRGEEYEFSQVTYDILKATSTTMRAYRSDADMIPILFIGYFKDQKYGSQIHSPRHCLPGSGWGILSHRQQIMDFHGISLPINRVVIGNRDDRQLMYYWFETRSGNITSEFALKFNLFLNALLMRPTDAAFIRLTVDLPRGGSEKSGEEILDKFLIDFYDSIENSLPFSS